MLKRQRPASPPPPTYFEAPASPPNKRFRITANLPERSHPSTSTPSPQHARTPQEPQEAVITNNYLYEVHALHRHRLLFASHTPGTAISDSREQAPPPPSHHYHPPSDGANHLEQEGGSSRSGLSTDSPDAVDTESVKKRYSETNRLLGSLVLARRRAVHGGGGGEPT